MASRLRATARLLTIVATGKKMPLRSWKKAS